MQGKRYLTLIDKYYIVDHTFKYARLGTKNINYGRVKEVNYESNNISVKRGFRLFK